MASGFSRRTDRRADGFMVAERLVYTLGQWRVSSSGSRVRALARRPRALRHRVSRFVVSVVPRSQRPPDHLAHDAAQGADALLRADDHARVGRGLPGALHARAQGRRGVPAQALQPALRRTRADAFRSYGLLAILVPSILPPPTPFKIFVLAAGVAKVRPVDFIIAIAIGRGFRYFGEGLLAVYYGDQAADFLHENATNGRAGRRHDGSSLGGAGWILWRRQQRPSGGLTIGPKACIINRLSVINAAGHLGRRPDEERGAQRGASSTRELTAALEAVRPSVRDPRSIDDGSTDDTFARLAELQSLGCQAARDPLPPQFRSDRRLCRRASLMPAGATSSPWTAICRTTRATSPRW